LSIFFHALSADNAHKTFQEDAMKSRMIAGAAGLLLVCCCFVIPAAQAQDKCNLKTFAGTYAFYDRGSSLILDPSVEPFPLHVAGAMASFIAVGQVTITAEGIGSGYYWIRAGTLNSGPVPVPLQLRVTEMNEDCTGKIQYLFRPPGAPEEAPTLIEERFVLFDNGREYRSIPSLIGENGLPTLAWTGVGRRIRKSDEPMNSCGPQTAQGTYLVSAENIVTPASDLGFADAVLLNIHVSKTGTYTGALYEKYGPYTVELPASGSVQVQPDCSFSSTLDIVIEGVPVTVDLSGVYFEPGKKYYGMLTNEGFAHGFVEGIRTGP
jgi:hypothetical protein